MLRIVRHGSVYQVQPGCLVNGFNEIRTIAAEVLTADSSRLGPSASAADLRKVECKALSVQSDSLDLDDIHVKSLTDDIRSVLPQRSPNSHTESRSVRM